MITARGLKLNTPIHYKGNVVYLTDLEYRYSGPRKTLISGWYYTAQQMEDRRLFDTLPQSSIDDGSMRSVAERLGMMYPVRTRIALDFWTRLRMRYVRGASS